MEQLIKTKTLCERLNMGKDTAIAFMASLGVYPIPLGVGRGRGNYWLESAVDAALRNKNAETQPKSTTRKPRIPKAPAVSLFSMSTKDAYAILTNNGPVQ